MKLFKYIFPLFIAAGFLFSCSSDDDNPAPPNDETVGLKLAKTFKDGNYTFELFTENGKFRDGYNELFIRLKDADNQPTTATLSWNPVMDMGAHSHSCPYSAIKKADGKQFLYKGYIVFNMAGAWNLNVDFTIDGQQRETTIDLDVDGPTGNKKDQRVFSIEGADGERYVMALIKPLNQPEVKTNDMTIGLFKMENMMHFPIVDNFKIKIDPRMPSMGNHGSPSNVNPVQGADGLYHGKLSLTMTGWWRINLMLENQNGELIKGEEVTEENEFSSIFFDIEF